MVKLSLSEGFHSMDMYVGGPVNLPLYSSPYSGLDSEWETAIVVKEGLLIQKSTAYTINSRHSASSLLRLHQPLI